MQDIVQRVLLRQALVDARETIIFEKALPEVSEGMIESMVIEETTNVARSGINSEQTQRAIINTFDEKLFDEILITILH
jgi:hypothetical protein